MAGYTRGRWGFLTNVVTPTDRQEARYRARARSPSLGRAHDSAADIATAPGEAPKRRIIFIVCASRWFHRGRMKKKVLNANARSKERGKARFFPLLRRTSKGTMKGGLMEGKTTKRRL